MQKLCFTLPSPYDELPLSCLVYEPDESPKGIVQLVHGMCEHKERYEELMAFLCEKGYVVACHDHRGHGDSVRSQEDWGWFGDTTGEAVVNDAIFFTEYLKEKYPDVPVTLFGHSMGSMVVRCYIQKREELIDKLVVCGSPSKNPLASIAVGLAKIIGFFKGTRHRSKTLTYLSTGKGDGRFKGEGKCAWLSKNRANVESYLQNPKCRYKFTCNGFENLFRLMANTYDKKRYEVKNSSLPIYFIAGADDPVIESEKQWNEAMAFMRAVGYENVSGKLYEGLRHEILQEEERGQVFDDLLAFVCL